MRGDGIAAPTATGPTATGIDCLEARQAAEYKGLQVEGAIRYGWQVSQIELAQGQIVGAAFAARRTGSTGEHAPATGQGQATRRLVVAVHQGSGQSVATGTDLTAAGVDRSRTGAAAAAVDQLDGAVRLDHLEARQAARGEALQVEGAARFSRQVGQIELAQGQTVDAAFAARRTRPAGEHAPATGQRQTTRRLVVGVHQSADQPVAAGTHGANGDADCVSAGGGGRR